MDIPAGFTVDNLCKDKRFDGRSYKFKSGAVDWWFRRKNKKDASVPVAIYFNGLQLSFIMWGKDEDNHLIVSYDRSGNIETQAEVVSGVTTFIVMKNSQGEWFKITVGAYGTNVPL
jgi:hypothetical protein